MSSASPLRVVVLISGSGSNLQALIDGQKAGELPIEIAAVISNRPGVKGLERATDAGIEAITLDHKGFASREAFDSALAQRIDGFEPQLVVLAGFMRILTPDFAQHYLGRMLNIHPSLLPKYQGLNTHQRALDAGDSEHGVTVHFVTAELDGGPAAIQAVVPVLKEDDASTLASRVQAQEHVIYPMAVKWFAEGTLRMHNNAAVLKGEPLPASGYQVRTNNV
ncbi:phosphoribosylglycinamide formyltransferase [Gilvimarinus sp. 1_MG-2023]|uniref:phosphoribosylglycinamide formyltransferase n=1 Tax=Gilvimarinus sp. 1_MG-2023 TaxID=3062638 RepID=UPI0026E36B35|nr:phosphoribosylglycinamide formyltransferase [Gilvimarinus sp. 1_MG-2023]MDO6747964.1 phosphoribosylglycinamide formyltransferase [Gilvimarinus sp. 1_MG-2023]